MDATPFSASSSPTTAQVATGLAYSLLIDIKNVLWLLVMAVFYKLGLVIGLCLIIMGRGFVNWTWSPSQVTPIHSSTSQQADTIKAENASIETNLPQVLKHKQPPFSSLAGGSVPINNHTPPLPSSTKVGFRLPSRPLGSEYDNSVRIHRVGSSAYFNIPLTYLLDKRLYYLKLAQMQNGNGNGGKEYHQLERQQQIVDQSLQRRGQSGPEVCRASWQALKTIMAVIYPDQAAAISKDEFALYHENALPSSEIADDTSPRTLIIQRFFRFFLSPGMDLAVEFTKINPEIIMAKEPKKKHT
ncbi:hypothetical protein NADFUDRAFT_83994 [Nadsonia fulvescens var. elongata DSM 6958]|uniref:Uncharacterized protein n=1 Tax=Nadsonia fulvescens var. elongata DSM 6958 TaxID=857566 RepID=A0A1E3PEU2_9ASCO|nr:hypothetical protein NADFUDRAFT_83994 [Nadsonia fulvescens var. elongata DSM 6958]